MFNQWNKDWLAWCFPLEKKMYANKREHERRKGVFAQSISTKPWVKHSKRARCIRSRFSSNVPAFICIPPFSRFLSLLSLRTLRNIFKTLRRVISEIKGIIKISIIYPRFSTLDVNANMKYFVSKEWLLCVYIHTYNLLLFVLAKFYFSKIVKFRNWLRNIAIKKLVRQKQTESLLKNMRKFRQNSIARHTAYCISPSAQSRRHSRRMMVMGKRVLEHGRWSGSRGSNYDWKAALFVRFL